MHNDGDPDLGRGAQAVKIAFLHFWTLRLPRGVETLTLSLANALAARGEEVSLLTALRTREPLVAPSPQVHVHEFPTFHYFEAKTIVPLYLATLAKERFNTVFTFFADFGEGPALAWADRVHRARHVLYLTFPPEAAPHRYYAYREYGWDRRADVLLADAAYTATQGQIFFNRPVQLLPSGTDPERFKPNPQQRTTMRARLGLNQEDIVLLNVAALEKRKGAWRVVEALPALRPQCPNLRYLILGEGPEHAQLETRAAELGVREAVLFAGTTNDLAPYYNAADIFVMLPDAEAGSIALLEAMASSLPTVVSDTPGMRELVNDQSGVRVEIKNHSALVQALSMLARNPEMRRSMGLRGRALIEKDYAWTALAQRLITLLN